MKDEATPLPARRRGLISRTTTLQGVDISGQPLPEKRVTLLARKR